jgi:hypothetical protein
MAFLLKRAIRSVIRRATKWLQEDKTPNLERLGPPPFSYNESNYFFKALLTQERLRRPHYLWGAIQAVNLAKALGISCVSFIEFGVAGGNGLTALESIAEKLKAVFAIEIEIHGFDAAEGMPKTSDPRDVPNLWRAGFYPMDVEKLKKRLTNTQLYLGGVDETVPKFTESRPAPIAFIAFDLCYYTSTKKAFEIFDAEQNLLLPRVHCFFRNILGRTFGDHNGERLAMAEFNTSHGVRKISKIYGLEHYIGPNLGRWVDQYYMAHICDHELYAQYDGLVLESALHLSE